MTTREKASIGAASSAIEGQSSTKARALLLQEAADALDLHHADYDHRHREGLADDLRRLAAALSAHKESQK